MGCHVSPTKWQVMICLSSKILRFVCTVAREVCVGSPRSEGGWFISIVNGRMNASCVSSMSQLNQ